MMRSNFGITIQQVSWPLRRTVNFWVVERSSSIVINLDSWGCLSCLLRGEEEGSAHACGMPDGTPYLSVLEILQPSASTVSMRWYPFMPKEALCKPHAIADSDIRVPIFHPWQIIITFHCRTCLKTTWRGTTASVFQLNAYDSCDNGHNRILRPVWPPTLMVICRGLA